MKKCPFCAEEIQDEAIKCKHCGEFFNQKPKEPWYCRSSTIIIVASTVGPLAIPLVWLNPRYTVFVKLLVSIIIVFLSVALYLYFQNLMAQLKQTLSASGINL